MFKFLTDAVDEKLSLIAPVLREIEQGGQGSLTCRISAHISFVLYACLSGTPAWKLRPMTCTRRQWRWLGRTRASRRPSARGRRLLKEAHLRFCSRLEAAADRFRPYEYLMVPDYPVRNAA